MKPFLLVDDRHDILSFLKWELKQHDVVSMQADNAEDALDLLMKVEYEVIFLDIVLGQSNSSSIVDFIRSKDNQINSEIKIILMSGLIDHDFMNKHKNKFYKILEKPFVDMDISEIVNDLRESLAPKVS